MLGQKERLNRFLKEIIDEAQEKRDEIIGELRQLRRDELASAKADAQRLCEERVALEEKRALTAQLGELEQEKEKLRRLLAVKREEVARSVIALAREKILAAGEAADALLARSLTDVCSRFEGQNFIVYVREKDMAKAQEILPENTQLRCDTDIELGGFRLECGSVFVDDTLDTRLQQEFDGVMERISLPILT
ncbi:MAG: V-type ATP synthase subunit E [Oscillospiraceae bacterium]|nr:V-type ATP synthase subunit E [Oscillospiraceae bacterium]